MTVSDRSCVVTYTSVCFGMAVQAISNSSERNGGAERIMVWRHSVRCRACLSKVDAMGQQGVAGLFQRGRPGIRRGVLVLLLAIRTCGHGLFARLDQTVVVEIYRATQKYNS